MICYLVLSSNSLKLAWGLFFKNRQKQIIWPLCFVCTKVLSSLGCHKKSYFEKAKYNLGSECVLFIFCFCCCVLFSFQNQRVDRWQEQKHHLKISSSSSSLLLLQIALCRCLQLPWRCFSLLGPYQFVCPILYEVGSEQFDICITF